MTNKLRLMAICLVVLSLVMVQVAAAQGDATIPWWVFSAGGGPVAGGSISMNGSLGQTAIGPVSSANYEAGDGYWYVGSSGIVVYLPLIMKPCSPWKWGVQACQ